MNMPKVIQTVLVLVACVSSQAQDIACPAGTKANGETTPDVSEAWCELFLEGGVVQHGPTRSWYPNGVLGTQGQFDRGQPTGTWYGWYDSGEKQGEIVYESGEKTSETYWDRLGNRIESVSSIELQRLADSRLATILSLGALRQIAGPPDVLILARLYEVPVEGSCVPETHWVCSHDYFLAVSTLDTAPEMAVYALGRIGKITETRLIGTRAGYQATVRFTTQAYPDTVLERVSTLNPERKSFIINFIEAQATIDDSQEHQP